MTPEPCTRLMPDGTTCLRPAVVVYATRSKRYPLCARHESMDARRWVETHPGWSRRAVPA